MSQPFVRITHLSDQALSPIRQPQYLAACSSKMSLTYPILADQISLYGEAIQPQVALRCALASTDPLATIRAAALQSRRALRPALLSLNSLHQPNAPYRM